MEVPLLDGYDIFGVGVRMNTGKDPRRVALNTYCGINGEEAIDCGGSGYWTFITGRTFQPSYVYFDAYQRYLESFMDGKAHVLFDNKGRTWNYVLMIEPPKWPEGRITRDVKGFTSRYEIMFKHLN